MPALTQITHNPNYTRLLIIRHGRTEWNVAGKIQGKTDTPLDEKGELESNQIAERLSRLYPIHCLYASPYIRAQQTASYIARLYNMEIKTDPDLVEVDFGDLASIRFDELEEKHPELFNQFNSFMLAHPDQGAFRPELPNGETMAEIENRVKRLTNRILSEHIGQCIAVVSHGAFIKCLVSYHSGISLSQRMPYWFENASLTIIDFYQDLPVIRCLNDIGHLGEAVRYFSPRLL